jgi:hypothetical protein
MTTNLHRRDSRNGPGPDDTPKQELDAKAWRVFWRAA